MPRAKFDNVLKAVPREVAKGARSALRQNGQEAVRIIQGDAPVDDGPLRQSIDWSFGDPPPGVLGGNKVKHTKVPAHLRISVWAGGPKAPHAHLVHNGTAERTTKGGGSRGIMPPQPFFWPNWRSLKRRLKGRISRKANKALKDLLK